MVKVECGVGGTRGEWGTRGVLRWYSLEKVVVVGVALVMDAKM